MDMKRSVESKSYSSALTWDELYPSSYRFDYKVTERLAKVMADAEARKSAKVVSTPRKCRRDLTIGGDALISKRRKSV